MSESLVTSIPANINDTTPHAVVDQRLPVVFSSMQSLNSTSDGEIFLVRCVSYGPCHFMRKGRQRQQPCTVLLCDFFRLEQFALEVSS